MKGKAFRMFEPPSPSHLDHNSPRITLYQKISSPVFLHFPLVCTYTFPLLPPHPHHYLAPKAVSPQVTKAEGPVIVVPVGLAHCRNGTARAMGMRGRAEIFTVGHGLLW